MTSLAGVELGGPLRRLLEVTRRGSRNEGVGERRLAAMVQGLIAGFGNRMLGILVSFISVPLTVGYLGPERYGAWVTIGSVLTWLQLADLGLGNGLTNAITSARGRGEHDMVRVYISSGAAALTAASLAMGVACIIAWPYIDWSAVLGVRSEAARGEVRLAMGIAIGFSLVNFPLTLVGRIYLAFQRGAQAGYWGVAGNLLSLVLLVTVTRLKGGLPLLVAATWGFGLIFTLASGAWFFLRQHPEASPRFSSIQPAAIRSVTQTGIMFFLIQILALIAFQTDNLVIARYLGASDVAPYNMVYKLFGYTTLLQSLLFSYIWVAYSDAIARGDIPWVKKAFRASVIGGTLVTAVVVVPLVFIAVPFIRWWTGGHITPGLDLVLWMAVWSVINAFTQAVASLLAAANHLKIQIMYSVVSSVLNLVLSIALVRTWGATGVIAGTVVAYLIAVCLPCIIDAELLLKRLSLSASRR